MTPSELRVRRVSHRGHVVEWVLNPLWVQLDQKIHAEFGIERLYLVSQGPPGLDREFSGTGRKSKLCQSFTGALQAAKRGPTYNPVTYDRLIGNRVVWTAARGPTSDSHDEPRHQ